MPPTAIKEGILRFSYPYTFDSHNNEFSFFVRPNSYTLATAVKRRDNTDIAFATVGGGYLNEVFKTEFLTSQAFSVCNVDQYIGGAWVQRATFDPGILGTATGGSQRVCAQLTLTFRDAANRFVKFHMFETINPGPASTKHGDTWSNLAAILAEYLPTDTSDAQAGNVVVSRSDEWLASFVGFSMMSSRRIRRERGFL